MKKLKACPFCGCEAVGIQTVEDLRGAGFRVVCDDCEASGPIIIARSDAPPDSSESLRRLALTLWNKRPA